MIPRVASLPSRRSGIRVMGPMSTPLTIDCRSSALVGNATAFADVVPRVPTLASAVEPLLIRGEAGTGKELYARAIHRASSRASRPYIALSCATLIDTGVDAELFTGTAGLIAQAAGGTLFLDEVETLTP